MVKCFVEHFVTLIQTVERRVTYFKRRVFDKGHFSIFFDLIASTIITVFAFVPDFADAAAASDLFTLLLPSSSSSFFNHIPRALFAFKTAPFCTFMKLFIYIFIKFSVLMKLFRACFLGKFKFQVMKGLPVSFRKLSIQ